MRHGKDFFSILKKASPPDKLSPQEMEQMWYGVKHAIHRVAFKKRFFPWWMVACILIFLGLGVFLLLDRSPAQAPLISQKEPALPSIQEKNLPFLESWSDEVVMAYEGEAKDARWAMVITTSTQ